MQDTILADEVALRQLLEKGAQVLVCGGRGMASSVSQVFNIILKPLNTNVDNLKAEGRYLEDVY